MKITPFRLASGLGILALVIGTVALISSRSQVESIQIPTIKNVRGKVGTVFGEEAQLNLV